MANVLVTGGAGFIGSNLVDKLIELGHKVFVVDDLSTGRKDYINTKAIFYDIDLANKDDQVWLDYYMRTDKIEIVYHVAALPRVEPSIIDPFTSHKINIDGTINLLKAVKNCSTIKKFVFSSSSSVYGEPKVTPTPETCELHPMSPYALHKQIGEQYLKLFSELYGLEVVCLRYFNVYGYRQPTVGSYVPVIGIWFEQMKNGKAVTVTGDGNQVRDFVCVDDVVQANIRAGFNCDSKFAIYNVGSGKNYNLNQIATEMLNVSNIQYLPSRIEPKYTLADISLIEKEIGYNPTIDLQSWIENHKPK
jgi:UDP-glucose 4-epimerase